MQPDRQENQNKHESRSAWWSRSADAFADFAYRYQTIIKVALVVFFIFYFAFAAIFLGLRYVVLPHVNEYKTEIEKLASESIGKNVRFSKITASWYGLQPKVDLENVTLSDDRGKEYVRLKNVSAVVSWWSVPLMDLRLASLVVDKPDINISRDRDGRFYVAGILVDPEKQTESGVADWILKQHEIIVRDGAIHWKDDFRHTAELNLDQFNFAMKNRGRKHRFRLTAVPDAHIADSIDIRGNLSHPRFEKKVSDVSKWKGDLYVALPNLNADQWKKYVDLPVELDGGTGSIQVWAGVDKSRLTEISAELDLKNLKLRLRKDLPVLDLAFATGRFDMKRLVNAGAEDDLQAHPFYSYGVDKLSLKTVSGKVLNDASFTASYLSPEGDNQLAKTEVDVKRLNLGELGNFLPYLPLDKELSQQIRRYELGGQLSNFSLSWENAQDELKAYSVNGNFSQLTLRETADGYQSSKPGLLPSNIGFQNLTGSASVNEYGGNLELDSPKSTLILPVYSRAVPQQFDELKMDVQWQRSLKNVLTVKMKDIAFRQADVKVKVSGQYTKELANKEDLYGSVDATARIENLDIDKVKHYIPLQTPKTLKEWLSGGLKGGKVSEGVIQIKGNLADFPYSVEKKKNTGVFKVNAKIVDGVLNYAPDMVNRNTRKPAWPIIEKIQGEFRMDGSLLSIHADKASTNNVGLKDVDVVIPNVLADNPVLNVDGKANGTLQNFVGFVNATPVIDWIGHLTDETTATGNADLLLEMQLPLEKMEKSVVKGTLKFGGNDIVLFRELPTIAKTQGQLYFSEKGFALEKISANFLHEPASISGGTQPNGRFLVRAEGTLSARGLQQVYSGGVMKQLVGKLSGSTPFLVNITDNELKVDSSLKGLKIDLPAPLGKQAASTVPLRFQMDNRPAVNGISRDVIDIAYGENIAARYLRQKTRQGSWQVVEGGLAINRPVRTRPGVTLDISMHNLDFNEWANVLSSLPSETARGRANDAVSGGGLEQYIDPDHFSIVADELMSMDTWLTNVSLNGSRSKNSIEASIRSDQMNGQIKWIDSNIRQVEGKLIARLSSMNILSSSVKKASDMSGRENVRRIPALDIIADDLVLYGKHLGRTEITANNVNFQGGREWRINKLKITNPDAILDASGSWISSTGNKQQTKLNYVLNIKDAGKLLDRFGYKGLIRRGKGEMKGEVSWDGLPFALDIPSMYGKLSLKIGAGQFLKADAGAARLLSVISLQSLPRRLTLDFRDVFSKGFAFDDISATAQIAKGIMKTDNMKMMGPNATVLMDGSVDIAKETQNLHVAVIPDFNAAAVSLAYGFINPAIGIGTFLAQLFLQKPLMKELTHEYQITGSWTNPEISEIKR